MWFCKKISSTCFEKIINSEGNLLSGKNTVKLTNDLLEVLKLILADLIVKVLQIIAIGRFATCYLFEALIKSQNIAVVKKERLRFQICVNYFS